MEEAEHVKGEGNTGENPVPDHQATDSEPKAGRAPSLRKVFQWNEVSGKLRNDAEVQKWEKYYKEAMSDYNQVRSASSTQ